MVAFQGMHILPVKHSHVWLPRKVWLPDRQTDAGQSDPHVPLCLAGNTKNSLQTVSYKFYYKISQVLSSGGICIPCVFISILLYRSLVLSQGSQFIVNGVCQNRMHLLLKHLMSDLNGLPWSSGATTTVTFNLLILMAWPIHHQSETMTLASSVLLNAYGTSKSKAWQMDRQTDRGTMDYKNLLWLCTGTGKSTRVSKICSPRRGWLSRGCCKSLTLGWISLSLYKVVVDYFSPTTLDPRNQPYFYFQKLLQNIFCLENGANLIWLNPDIVWFMTS